MKNGRYVVLVRQELWAKTNDSIKNVILWLKQ